MNIAPLLAHRGACAYAPENTFKAFDKARELGAHGIELDVMMCADGGLFIFHDETLDRTSNGTGAFASAKSKTIQTLDAGAWFAPRFTGEKIPSLNDTIDWFCAHQMQANFEIKPSPGAAKALTETFLKAMPTAWPRNVPKPLISSFDPDVLQVCVKLAPKLPLGVLFEKKEKHWMALAETVGAVSIHVDKYWVTPKRIQAIKNAGYQVCVYTVNSKEWATRYLAWGADSIVSDYPDLLDA